MDIVEILIDLNGPITDEDRLKAADRIKMLERRNEYFHKKVEFLISQLRDEIEKDR